MVLIAVMPATDVYLIIVCCLVQ